MTARPRPPIPYDFLPEVPSFEVTSDDIADGGTLADAHVQAEGNTSPHLRYLGPDSSAPAAQVGLNLTPHTLARALIIATYATG